MPVHAYQQTTALFSWALELRSQRAFGRRERTRDERSVIVCVVARANKVAAVLVFRLCDFLERSDGRVWNADVDVL